LPYAKDALIFTGSIYTILDKKTVPKDIRFHFININQSFNRFSLTEPEIKGLIIYNIVFNKTELQQTASGIRCVRIAALSTGKYCLAELID